MSTDTDAHVGGGGTGHPSVACSHGARVTAAELWRLAVALPGWDAAACGPAARRLGELCAARIDMDVSGPWRSSSESVDAPGDVVITLVDRDRGVVCAWLELEAGLARGVVDLALGGTADTAELALVETLDTTRTGVLLYMAACVLSSVPQDVLRIHDVRPASEAPRPARIGCTARVSAQGHVFGARLTVDPLALSVPVPPLAPTLRAAQPVPSWARDAACQVTLELARGALDAVSLGSLAPGDVLVPDVVVAEPGAWETATLRCDAFPTALATVRVDADGALLLADGTPAATGLGATVPAGLVPFTIEAARVSASLSDVLRWVSAGRLPLRVDPRAPLTVWEGAQATARGRLVRDRGSVGLCIETARPMDAETRPYDVAIPAQSSDGSPKTSA